MYTLHCTAKLRDRLKQPLSEAPRQPSTALGDWYAAALFWKPQLALLVNERTLLPVLLPLAPAANLPARIAPAVAQVLQMHGIRQDLIEGEVAAMAEVSVAKTANRSVGGTMNEFEFQAEVYRDHSGITDLLQLAMRLAEMPCWAIKGNSPARLLREVAAGTVVPRSIRSRSSRESDRANASRARTVATSSRPPAVGMTTTRSERAEVGIVGEEEGF